MTAKRPMIAGWCAFVLATSSLAACTFNQIMIGQFYRIYTPSAGACPVLEWDFVVDPARRISGSLLRGNQGKIATLSGTLAQDESFHINATSVVDEHRTAAITGRFTSQVSVVSIHGDAAGSACDGQTFKLRLGAYFALQGRGDFER
jgi:hypothetical protein